MILALFPKQSQEFRSPTPPPLSSVNTPQRGTQLRGWSKNKHSSRARLGKLGDLLWSIRELPAAPGLWPAASAPVPCNPLTGLPTSSGQPGHDTRSPRDKESSGARLLLSSRPLTYLSREVEELVSHHEQLFGSRILEDVPRSAGKLTSKVLKSTFVLIHNLNFIRPRAFIRGFIICGIFFNLCYLRVSNIHI